MMKSGSNAICWKNRQFEVKIEWITKITYSNLSLQIHYFLFPPKKKEGRRKGGNNIQLSYI